LSQTDLGLLARGDTGILKAISRHEWDEHLLGTISKSTAEWIVKEHSTGPEKERLGGFLTKRYKPSEDLAKPVAPASRRDSKPQDSLDIKRKTKENKAKQNADLHFTPSFILSSRVGDKKLKTQNIYQQQLLGGAKHVASKKSKDQNTIVLDTNEKVKFKKHLQDNFPQAPISWYPSEIKHQTSTTSQVGRQKKGLQRWKDLPSVVQVRLQSVNNDYYCR